MIPLTRSVSTSALTPTDRIGSQGRTRSEGGSLTCPEQPWSVCLPRGYRFGNLRLRAPHLKLPERHIPGVPVKRTILQSLTLRAVVPSALMLLVSVPAEAFAAAPAQDHLVSPQVMQKQMADSAVARQKNIETVTNFLSSPEADRAIRDAHYNPEQVRNAIPSLSDHELASLAARSADVQQNFAAGRLTKPELALIVVAFVVLIVVIIVH
jgi:hypothetical protein